jgi:methionine synthase II (cobalamin-independent)
MDFNPRTATGIPTEPVGSIPRPLKLQQAYAAYDAKKISKAQLEEEQNAAVADTIKRFEATGSPIITDGEQRVSSFATYPIADTLAGTGLATNLAPGGQYFAIFADGHNRQLPKITGGPFHYNFYAGELVKKAVKITSKPLHQAVIAPSMMYLLYPLDG